MTNSNNRVFSPVLGDQGVAQFHTSGANFSVNEKGITQVRNTDRTFEALVEAMYMFDVNESGIKAYYDLRNNMFVKQADQTSLDNSDNFFKLTEMKQFLTEKKREVKLANNTSVLEDIENELTEVNGKLSESTKMPMVTSFTYDSASNKAYINTTEILDEDIANHIFATGHVVYEHKQYLSLFEVAARNFKAYQELTFVREINEGTVSYSVMRKDDTAYVYRFNSATRIAKLSNMAITEAIDYILENTGQDVTDLFEDVIESAKENKAKVDEKISNLYEMISFLKDKRGDLANANKAIQEIKEADQMINQEIERLMKEIEVLEAEGITRNDGYVPGTVEVDVEGLSAGDEIMVDAVAYAAAGSDDPITFFVEDKPFKAEKRFIALAAGETV
jgi:hypothetical protein